MGAIHFSVDRELIQALKRRLPFSVFFETGTFKAETTLSVAALFPKIITVELSRELFDGARAKLSHLPHILPIHASSPDALRQMAADLREASVAYWLDAHWCGDVTAGVEHECPLLEEIEAIGALNDESVVLIDDARLFLAPPPEPHVASQWPQLGDVAQALHRLSDRHRLWVINDVIIFAPRSVEADVVAYGRTHGVDMNALYRESKQLPQAIRERDMAAADVARLQRASLAKPSSPAEPVASAGLNGSIAAYDRSERLFAWHLGRLGITRVLDVGSNTGQFAGKLRALGYDGMIFSVEPQAGCYAELLANARAEPRWVVLPRQGAGAEQGFFELRRSENSYSSSILEVHQNHLDADSATRTVAVERVFVNRTSELMRAELMASIEAVKIDVQGFERKVLEGLLQDIGHIRLLQVELSMVECYAGAPDLFALDSWIVEELGFERISLEPCYYDEAKAVAQQYDGLYCRADSRVADDTAKLGVQLTDVITSIGGPIRRLTRNGTDVGGNWFRLCVKSWGNIASTIVSVSECEPMVSAIKWKKTEKKPSIAELFRAIEAESDKHVLLTNADIALTDVIKALLPRLEPSVVYYGNRLDVEDPQGSGQLVTKGVYQGGFDFFILPPSFVRVINRDDAFPDFFHVGEPWWDYYLPIIALAKGFPTKKLVLAKPLGLHFAHEPKYAHDLWIKNGERFLGCLQTLSALPGCPVPGLLEEILSASSEYEDRDKALQQVSYVVCTAVP